MDYLENKKYKVIWLNSFKDELSHIYHYLSENLNEFSITNNFHRKVFKALSNLSYFPEMYQKINHEKNIRRITIDKYVILYTVDDNTGQVFILHIFHSSQNYLDRL